MTQKQNASESFLQYSQLFRDRPDDGGDDWVMIILVIVPMIGATIDPDCPKDRGSNSLRSFCLVDWAGKMPTPQEFQVIKFAFLSV